MRRQILPATAALALVLAGLTACSAAPAPAECADGLAPGALTDNVMVLGEQGGDAQIKVPSDIQIMNTQRTFVTKAADRDMLATSGTLAAVNVVFLDSLTGDEIYRSAHFGTDDAAEFVLVTDDSGFPALTEGLRCAAAGDRVIVATSPEESLPMVTTYGLTPGASFVAVIDVLEVSPLAASGSARALPSGFPAVATLETGQPGIVLPPQDAPTSTKTALRIKGHGDVVTADAMVIAQVLTVTWTGDVVRNTWDSGPVNAGTEAQVEQSGATFRPFLTGLNVGSQLVIIEPGELGTNVSVIDILAG